VQQTKTLILGVLFAFAASAAAAQMNVGGGVNLDPGVSGGTSGLISGGGPVSVPLDARAPSNPRSQASQAKVQDARPVKNQPSPGSQANARADARASIEADTSTRATKPKKERPPAAYRSYPSFFGFMAFGGRRY